MTSSWIWIGLRSAADEASRDGCSMRPLCPTRDGAEAVHGMQDRVILWQIVSCPTNPWPFSMPHTFAEIVFLRWCAASAVMRLVRCLCCEALGALPLLRGAWCAALAARRLVRCPCCKALGALPLLRGAWCAALAARRLVRCPCCEALGALSLLQGAWCAVFAARRLVRCHCCDPHCPCCDPLMRWPRCDSLGSLTLL